MLALRCGFEDHSFQLVSFFEPVSSMVICTGCEQSFPRITSKNTRCGKCLSRKPGLSAPEMEAVNVGFIRF